MRQSTSMTDEDTFRRVFGNCHWAIMFVVAQEGQSYARIRFNVGPGGQVLIPVEVDYDYDFASTDHKAWDAEYQANVQVDSFMADNKNKLQVTAAMDLDKFALPHDFMDEFEDMEPAERQFILDELADRPELWNEEEVMFL